MFDIPKVLVPKSGFDFNPVLYIGTSNPKVTLIPKIDRPNTVRRSIYLISCVDPCVRLPNEALHHGRGSEPMRPKTTTNQFQRGGTFRTNVPEDQIQFRRRGRCCARCGRGRLSCICLSLHSHFINSIVSQSYLIG